MPPVPTFCYFFEAVQNRGDGLDCLMCCHRFCAAAQIKLALLSIKGLVAEFATRERVLILGKLILEAILSLNRISDAISVPYPRQ